MKPQQIQLLTTTFEGHAQRAISNAKTACALSGHAIADHFPDVGKMVELALIRSNSDQALFGKSTPAMKAQWQVPDARPLADFAPTIILKAKDFATEITIHNARTQQMQSGKQISSEHVTNNEAVRQTLLNRGIRPENLLPKEDVKKVERKLASADKKTLQNPDKLENGKVSDE